MSVSIRTHLESDTIRIPEASALIGQDVRITIAPIDAPEPAFRRYLDGLPFDPQKLLRAFDEARAAGVDFDDEAMAELDPQSTL